MTDDRTAFLRCICEMPDDDLPRLVFADWLDEHDEPERAEFIRVQCGLARTSCPEICRERELLDNHWSKWIREAGLVPDGWKLSTDGDQFHIWRDEPFDDGYRFIFRRGFIEDIYCRAEDWLRVADSLVWCPQKCPDCDGSKSYGYFNKIDRCRGAGRVLPTMPCPKCNGSGDRYPDVPPHDTNPDCSSCSGTGRVPRRFPATAQPIRTVRLMTQPDPDPDFRSSEPIWGAVTAANGHSFQTDRWPGITFHLPPRFA